MKFSLKPIDQQTIVVTGASSGIGLATAKAAAAAGARVMLAARDDSALASICFEIRNDGGKADYLRTDVGEESEVQALADKTIERFGGFDSWVNNAGVGLITTVEKMSSADHKQIFQTNYFGAAYGSVAAVKHFRETGKPGALINVGSVVSDMALPLSVAYSATKHALKGFTDGLRIEIMQAELPISVTLIKPSVIDTQFFDHAKSEMGGKGKGPGPHYAPEVVADAILYAAQHQKRDFPVGATAVAGPAAASLAPGLADRQQAALRYADLVDFGNMPSGESLYAAPQEGRERSRNGYGRRYSLTTTAQTHPGTTLGLVAAAGGAVLTLLALRSSARARDRHYPRIR